MLLFFNFSFNFFTKTRFTYTFTNYRNNLAVEIDSQIDCKSEIRY